MDKLQLMIDAQEMAGWDESCPVVFQNLATGEDCSVDEVAYHSDSTGATLFLRGRPIQ